MMAYFGEVIKMCANISYIMMTLNRYLLVGKDHQPWLVTIAKLEFKWVIRGSLLFSFLINIGHGWQYRAVDDQAFSHSFNSIYSRINGNADSDYPQANQDLSYFIYSVVYFVINFGFFFIINMGLEAKLVRRMHKELQEKKDRQEKMNASSSSTSSPLTEAARIIQENKNKKKEKENVKKERKLIKMVVLNSVFNSVLRAPDMFFWIENTDSWCLLFTCLNNQLRNNVDLFPGLLSFMTDISYLTYIMTFTTNFFIFYKFNKNFKEAVVFFECLK
jgi:hypothetical protein